MTASPVETERNNEPGGKRLIWLSVNSSYSHSSPALPLIHSACGGITSWEWIPLETTVADDPAEVASRLASLRGDLLCTTLYLFNRNCILEILERFHALSPDCRIAAGGPECLGEGAELLHKRAPFLHAVFRGEGEAAFPDFLKSFDSVQEAQIIPPQGNAVYDAWEAAPPAVEDSFFRTDKPFVQMETSRGCPMGCIYCTSGRTKTRFKSLEAVSEELNLLRLRGVKEIRLLDRTFNLPQERGAALLRLFRENFPELRFHLEIHPQFLKEELREELRRAIPGQLHLEAGIQCLAEHVQTAIERFSTPRDALDGLSFLCSSPNFQTHADLLAGLPEQSLEDLFRDVSSLMQAGPAEIQLEILKVLPGTPLRQLAERFGIIYAPEPPYDVMRTASFSTDDILLARTLSRFLDLTYNHPALHRVIRAIHAETPEILPELLAFFQRNGLEPKRLFDLKKRFLLLEEFLSARPCRKAQEALAFHWICSGYPPENGPGTMVRKADSIPRDALILNGNPNAAEERESKFWMLPGTESTFYFAFNRNYAMNRPAGVWRRGTDSEENAQKQS